jgi:hypothetical protein
VGVLENALALALTLALALSLLVLPAFKQIGGAIFSRFLSSPG